MQFDLGVKMKPGFHLRSRGPQYRPSTSSDNRGGRSMTRASGTSSSTAPDGTLTPTDSSSNPCIQSASNATQPTDRELRFKNPLGEILIGWLLDAGSKKNLVLLCHGYMSNATHCHFQRLAAALASRGVSSFRFDHAMAVDSAVQRARPFRMGNHAEEVAEIQAAIDFLAVSGYTTTCVLGHSKGGLNAFIFGATAPRPPPLVVLLSGRFKPKDGTLQRYGADVLERLAANHGIVRTESNGMQWTLTLEDVTERLSLDIPALASRWPPSTRLVAIHGTADTTIPWAEAQYLAGLVTSTVLELVLLPGANHNYTAHAQELEAAVLAAVTEHAGSS